MSLLISSIIALFITQTQRVHAQNLDDYLDGFDDQTSTDVAKPKETKTNKKNTNTRPAWYRLSGELGVLSTYNFKAQDSNFKGVSSAQLFGGLTADFKFSDNLKARVSLRGFYDFIYALEGRKNYTDELIKSKESELELSENYIAATFLKNIDLKIGRQIITWGVADSIRVVDLLNPIDNRTPGIVDIKDQKLPLLSTKLDYYYNDLNLSFIAIHELRFNKMPAYGSDFYSWQMNLEDEYSSDLFKSNEVALAMTGTLGNVDLGLYLTSVYDDTPYLTTTNNTQILKHQRIWMAGLSSVATFGHWLIKNELAFLHNLRLGSNPEKFNRIDILLGVEYQGIKETIIAFEIVNRHLSSFNKQLEAPPSYLKKDEVQEVLRISRDFLHDRLTLTLMTSLFGLLGERGSFFRLSTEYDLSDAINLSGGIIFYNSGNHPLFKTIGDNDRIFFNMSYQF